LVNQESLRHLEITLVHMILTHEIPLAPLTFFSRCAECGDSMEREDSDKIQALRCSATTTYKSQDGGVV
jgi:hypothetical protein